MKKIKSILAYYFKFILELSPTLYINVLKFKYKNRWFYNNILNETSDVMIEGFPRSANSFAVLAFKHSQDRKINFATHTHSHTHVLKVIKTNIPCLVLIRKPSDAIVSLKSLYIETALKGRKSDKDIPVSYLIRWYIRFYKALYPYRNQFVYAEFKEVTTDFATIIERINLKYNTNFTSFTHTPENEARIFELGGQHLSPNKKRNQIKEQVKNEYFDDSNIKLREEAEKIYYKFITI